MAKQAKNLRGFKLARYAYEKLQALRIPPRFQEAIDLGSVTIRSKPFHDSEVSVRACMYACYHPIQTVPRLRGECACVRVCVLPTGSKPFHDSEVNVRT